MPTLTYRVQPALSGLFLVPVHRGVVLTGSSTDLDFLSFRNTNFTFHPSGSIDCCVEALGSAFCQLIA